MIVRSASNHQCTWTRLRADTAGSCGVLTARCFSKRAGSHRRRTRFRKRTMQPTKTNKTKQNNIKEALSDNNASLYPSFWKSPVSWYSMKLETHPLTTKCLSSGFIAGSGDVLCQYLFFCKDKEKKRFNWDWVRTSRFTVLGFGLVAPVVHFWYKSLMTRIPGTSLAVVSQRTFFDQAFFAPIFIPTFLLNLCMLEGKPPQETIEKLKQDLPPTLVTNWCLWIPAQVVNFGLVPSKYQVLFSNMVGFVWNAYLSWRTQEPHSEQ